MRRLRRAVELGLPILGTALVLAALLLTDLYVRIGVVLLGLVLIEAGIWHLASPVLPSERKFVALRREVDGFIQLVRRLNRASLELTGDPSPQNRGRLLAVRDEMLESVKRMEEFAGRTEDDVLAAVAAAATGVDEASPRTS